VAQDRVTISSVEKRGAMEVKLIVLEGKNAGKEIPVPGPKFFIGRAEDCHLRPQSDAVSRHHCAVLVENGFVSVRDFGSKNGTFVNGERITTERELKTGDHLKVGPLEFEVRLSVPVGGKKKPKVKSVQEAAARTAQSSDLEDDDITDWLSEGDRDASGRETLVVSGGPTDEIDPDAVTDEAEGDQPGDKKKGKPSGLPPGALSKAKNPEATSSRDAAADMLKEFFKR
jgi:predicted component of type VI protein secretion system